MVPCRHQGSYRGIVPLLTIPYIPYYPLLKILVMDPHDCTFLSSLKFKVEVTWGKKISLSLHQFSVILHVRIGSWSSVPYFSGRGHPSCILVYLEAYPNIYQPSVISSSSSQALHARRYCLHRLSCLSLSSCGIIPLVWQSHPFRCSVIFYNQASFWLRAEHPKLVVDITTSQCGPVMQLINVMEWT